MTTITDVIDITQHDIETISLDELSSALSCAVLYVWCDEGIHGSPFVWEESQIAALDAVRPGFAVFHRYTLSTLTN